MKTALSLALALALTLAVVPAMAGNETVGSEAPAIFHALNQLPAAERATLAPMTDDQLAAVEGRNPCGVISASEGGSVDCSSVINVIQINDCDGVGNICANAAVLNF